MDDFVAAAWRISLEKWFKRRRFYDWHTHTVMCHLPTHTMTHQNVLFMHFWHKTQAYSLKHLHEQLAQTHTFIFITKALTRFRANFFTTFRLSFVQRHLHWLQNAQIDKKKRAVLTELFTHNARKMHLNGF